jgi:hypothetical protein
VTPIWSAEVAGETESEFNSGYTVTVELALRLSRLADIEVDPAVPAVSKPFSSVFATAGFELDQVTSPVMSFVVPSV